MTHEQLISAWYHETGRGVPILGFGLECGDAQRGSVGPQCLCAPKRLNTLKGKVSISATYNRITWTKI